MSVTTTMIEALQHNNNDKILILLLGGKKYAYPFKTDFKFYCFRFVSACDVWVTKLFRIKVVGIINRIK
jgi:hypothetical protein